MKTTLILVLVVLSFSLFSQNARIDSLQQEVNKAKGTDRILQLNELALEYLNVDSKKSISLGNEALQLAKQLKFYKVKAKTYNIISVAYYISNNLAAADKYCDNSLEVSKTYGTDLDRMKSLRNKTTYYTCGYRTKNFKLHSYLDELLKLSCKRGEYELFNDAVNNVILVNAVQKINDFNILAYLDSIENKADDKLKTTIYLLYTSYYNWNKQYFKSIVQLKKILKISNDKFIRIKCYMTLGDTYFNLRRFKESEQYYLDALKINDTYNDNNLVYFKEQLYFDLEAIYIELRNYKQAYKYSIIPPSNLGFKLPMEARCLNYSNLGRIYLGLDSLEKAKYYINRALLLSDSVNLKIIKLTALQTKVKLLKKQNGDKNLQETILEMAQIIDSVHDDYTTYEGYKILTDYYKSTSDYKKSRYYLEKWTVVNDSLKSRESMQIFNEFQTNYETEKKEQRISLQQSIIKQKDQFIVLSIITGIIIFAALIVIYILYKIKNKAYKQLVFQSLQNVNITLPLEPYEDNTLNDESKNDSKHNHILLDEKIKSQIETALNYQLDVKIFITPDITLKMLAQKCHTNRSYLSQFINERYAMNFNTFINSLRINEAKQILSDPNNRLPLKELYLRLGYHSYSVFNEAFKRHVGVTPAFYLKTIKNLPDVSNPNNPIGLN